MFDSPYCSTSPGIYVQMLDTYLLRREIFGSLKKHIILCSSAVGSSGLVTKVSDKHSVQFLYRSMHFSSLLHDKHALLPILQQARKGSLSLFNV